MYLTKENDCLDFEPNSSLDPGLLPAPECYIFQITHTHLIFKLIHPTPIPWLPLLDYGKISRKELSHKGWCTWGMSFKCICRVHQLTLCAQQLATQDNTRCQILPQRGHTPPERPEPISADWGQRECTSRRWRENHTETNLGDTIQFRWKGGRDHQCLPWGHW